MSRTSAENLLRHYFRAAFEGAGLGWDHDNDAEIDQLVGAIQQMVDDAVREHAEDAPHIYADGSTA